MAGSSALQMLQAELTAVKAQNVRLEEENMLLRHRLNRTTGDHKSNAALNVEAKIRSFQLEEERDQVVGTLQQYKKRYNKLHEAYLEKVTRCKALEEMFKRQKTLTGLVMKSSLDQRQTEQKVLQDKRTEGSEVEQMQVKLSKMQAALDESYDIIDEMDFELESIDLLEMQNQSLRQELAALKLTKVDDEDPPPKYEEGDSMVERRNYRKMVASSNCESFRTVDDADAETLERAALTHSLVETAEAESHCLRRELLRSRWQQTVRRKMDKEQD